MGNLDSFSGNFGQLWREIWTTVYYKLNNNDIEPVFYQDDVAGVCKL
jgi:hypothetical protein